MSLRELAARRGLIVGSCYNPAAFAEDPRYGEVLAREFNGIVAENHMKFRFLQPERGRFTFEVADAMLDFAEAHGMMARGHTLVWQHSNPDWLEQGDFTRAEMLEIMRAHIHAVLGHFRGRIAAWDVVNEAISDDHDGFRAKNIWFQRVGDDFVDHAFRFAHEADPTMALFYNDYDIEWVDAKFERTYRLVAGMLERGVPVHGVGLQYHTRAMDAPKPEAVLKKIAAFNALGLTVHLTELDIKIPTQATEKDYREQAEVMAGITHVALEAKDCPAIFFWGFTDKYSWIPNFTKGEYDHTLPFDRDYRPKAMYEAMATVLTGE
ncbi:MAG: Endo-1,4-beta-xylanase Z precursor [bacterium ADurb.Bin429]|nr:MAG: Endo-1,4-beta-xylanase Z precursor [bacterium ADurb.Bin429]